MTFTLDIILIALSLILLIVGIIGCFLPILPGPPIAYGGFLAAFFVSYCHFEVSTLIILGVIMVVVTVLDFLVPSWATKKFGGTKWGSRGAAIGILVSLFGLAWWAIFLAPFAGAFIGELLYLKKHGQKTEGNMKAVWKAAFGAFLGMMCGIMMKLIYSCFVFFVVVKEFIMGVFG
jgi:uncharacterized protein YqgC (DUF456 family)